MKFFISTLFACMIVVIGCSKDVYQKSAQAPTQEAEAVQGTTPIPKDASLAIVFAEIAPADPISSKPLVIQYVAKDSKDSQERKIISRFRWYVDGNLVPEADEYMLEPRFFSKRAKVEAIVIATAEGMEGTSLRTAAVTIKNTPPAVTAVDLSPDKAYIGDRITAVPTGSDWDGDAITYLYQWEVGGKTVPGANKAEFDTSGLKSRSVIMVMVTPVDGEDQGAPFRSPKSIELGKRPPQITSNPPTAIVNGLYVYQVTAKHPEGSPLTYSLVNAPEDMTIDPSTGFIRWEVPKTMAMGQRMSFNISADDGDGGIASQEITLFLEMK